MVGMPAPSLNPCVGSGGGFGGRFCSFGRGWADDAAGWEIYGVSVRTFAWIGRGSDAWTDRAWARPELQAV